MTLTVGPATPIGKLESKSIVTTTNCFEWQGYTVGKGYGRTNWQGKAWLVHRLAWTTVYGIIPAGLQIDHLCENKRCWNVDHLEPVTNKVNNQRQSVRHPVCKYGHHLTAGAAYRYGGRVVCKQCQARRAAEYYRRKHG